MSEFYTKLSNRIINNEQFKIGTSALFASYIKMLIGEKDTISKELAKNITTASQVFYKSEDEKYLKEGANLLSMLIDSCGIDYPEIIPIAAHVFTSTGDFPNIELLENRFPEIQFKHNFLSEATFDFRRSLNNVETLNIILTDFQKRLWDNLQRGDDVITVAPTSAGKTHIILNYLVDSVLDSIDGAFAVIVVPTRALITEVSSKIYNLAKDRKREKEIEICTIPRDGNFSDKTFFVMTQERLHEVLLRGDMSFNYLFIDEAHNISDESRGVLLHLTLEKVLDNGTPQIIIGMPSPQYQNSFTSVFNDIPFKKEITSHSPVSKLIMNVRPKGRNLEIDRLHTEDKVIIPKNFKEKKLADIVYRLGKNNSNIIYRNQTNYCESIAQDISNRIEAISDNEALVEASEYIKHFIHEEFTLASNLLKGVAFHYSPLPTSVRIMVENLAKEGHVKYICCTSTLAEGVNLPAKNLFIQNPFFKKKFQSPERLEDVKINNITGRAGRMLQHFSGNIFLIEPDTWAFDDYFIESDEVKEEKIPTYFKLINDKTDDVIMALSGQYPREDEQYKFYSVANKLIKAFDNGSLDNTLSAPEVKLEIDVIRRLRNDVEEAFLNLKVSSLVLESNPTIGYIQQNKVYEFLMSGIDLHEWSLPHPKSEDLYDRLLKISTKLVEYGVFIPSGNYTAKYICLISKKWIQGNSLKEMISEQIHWDNTSLSQDANDENEGINEVKVNKSVRNVINVINSDVRFRLSNAIKCYYTLFVLAARMKRSDVQSVKLHYFLEIGASDERMMDLLNLGLSREASKEIDDKVPSGVPIKNLADLIRLLNSESISRIHIVIKKEIEHLVNRS
ncbi:DEAD/DEAH box helicase [Morganella morganii]